MASQSTMLLVWEFPWLASEPGVLGSWRAAFSASWCVSVAAWGGGGAVRVPVAEEASAWRARAARWLCCAHRTRVSSPRLLVLFVIMSVKRLQLWKSGAPSNSYCTRRSPLPVPFFPSSSPPVTGLCREQVRILLI